MKLIEKYFNEVEDCRKIKYNEDYFIIYAFIGEELQIIDAYVNENKRGTGLFKEVMKEIEKEAKNSGCTYIASTTKPKQTRSVMYQTKNKYEIKGIVKDSLVFCKEL